MKNWTRSVSKGAVYSSVSLFHSVSMKAQHFVSISMNFLMISPHWSESVLTLITRLDLIQEVLYSDAQILASPFDV